MEIFHAETIVDYNGTVVALGNFDGLHVAHMEIIRNGIKYAHEHGLKAGVLLFEENSKNITGTRKIELITPNEAKLELLEREKPDFVYLRKFTREFMQKSPEEFVKLLVKNLKVRAVCVGYDYSFGYKAQGDVVMLRELGRKYGFEVFVTDVIKIDSEVVSSTAIREMIKSGDMEKAERFLGRRFCVEGNVVRGLQNGTKMGIPTANVAYDENMAIPKAGVYAGITYVDKKRLKSVINVGKNPTFDAKKLTIESHILGFNDNIYGKYIRVSFAKQMRGDIKFESIDELVAQIKTDIKEVEKMEL